MEKCENFPHWQVVFNSPDKVVKASLYVYSTKLDKLYIQDDKLCPVSFQFNTSFADLCNYRLRGWVAFKEKGTNDIVNCCHHHLNVKSETKDWPGLGILRYEPSEVIYEMHCGHHSAVTNLINLKLDDNPRFEEENKWLAKVDLNIRMRCLSSCQSINRRPTKLVFVLEDLRGQEIRRREVNLKICKCPGRDRENEEKPTTKRKRQLKEICDQIDHWANQAESPDNQSDDSLKRIKLNLEDISPRKNVALDYQAFVMNLGNASLYQLEEGNGNVSPDLQTIKDPEGQAIKIVITIPKGQGMQNSAPKFELAK